MTSSDPFADYDLAGFYDEVFEPNGAVRPEYELVVQRLRTLGSDELARRQQLKDQLFHTRDITFTVYSDDTGTERTFPLDLVPRLITADVWRDIERGLGQRLRALNQFLGDVYDGDCAIVNDGIVPRRVLEQANGYTKLAQGIPQAYNARALVAGIDLVRDGEGRFVVLEDNLRVPSGASYVLENRLAMTRLLPRVMGEINIRTVEQYPTLLLRALQSIAPARAGEHPTVVLLTPGPFNSAYFEHAFLAENMGIQLVQGSDLFVEDESVWMRTTRGRTRVDVIYRRIDDEFLDPEVGRPDSVLGVPGLVSVARAGGVSLANALGNGAADDKAMYVYVPEMIRYYLGEEPILPNVETFMLSDPDRRAAVFSDPTPWVVKPVDGSGGYGIFVGPQATEAEVEEMVAEVTAEPDRFIAQKVIKLSRHPTMIDGRLEPRHVDLRPFVVGGEYIDVLPGGLTRVALRRGSLVVNSSQGGGSKDTWVERAPDHKQGISRSFDQQGRFDTDTVLARVAEPLFWTGRYLERMDGTARFLAEAHHGVLSGLPVEAGLRWGELLEVLTLTEDYAETGRERATTEVTRFLVDDRDNPGSIMSCLASARANLRQVREKIPIELRTAVNDAWAGLQAIDFDAELRDAPQNLFIHVARSSETFHGITEVGMSRNDGWRFLSLGRLTERALLNARLIDVYFVRMMGNSRPPVRVWINLMRAAGALQEYRRVFQTSLEPLDAIAFLVGDAEFPRSLRWNLEHSAALVGAMTGFDRRQDSRALSLMVELAERVALPLPDLLGDDPSRALRAVAAGLEQFSDEVHAEFFEAGR